MGIAPGVWGPYAWGMIHLFCLGAPDALNDPAKQAFQVFFQQLPLLLPCATCQQHLQDNLERVPLDAEALSGREGLFAWSVRLHNLVNQQTGKPSMSMEDARAHWEKVMQGQLTPSPCRAAPAKGRAWVVAAVGLLLLAVLLLLWHLWPRHAPMIIKSKGR